LRRDSVESLTDTDYWDRAWSQREAPEPLDPRAGGLNGTVARYWHAFFAKTFRTLGIRADERLLEAGCGGSIFLPYFVREYGLIAEGVDNSPEGCALSNAIARRCGIATPVHSCDVLQPPASLRGRYRVVFSMGLAEHFTPTSSIVSALASFLEPGGFLITVVPNMHGLVGTLQSLVDPAVYRVHVPLSPTQLAAAHAQCALRVLDAAHAMTANFSVVNFSGPGSRVPPALSLRMASWGSKIIWGLERIGLPEIPNRWTSPYVVVVAQRVGS
jgi:2-polyprenyl-3-methyl-5-hydroxy-6-metoxy-1,4-benzoquinol methylase